MNLTLTLLMLARQTAAAPPVVGAAPTPNGVVVEVVCANPRDERVWCSAEVDTATDELVITSSARSWDRVQAAFDDPGPGQLVRILLPEPGSAPRLAGMVRDAHPHLDVVEDARSNMILVSSRRA